jgi:hypothetical protein
MMLAMGELSFSHLTFLAFSVFCAVRLVSYFPQIVRVYRDANGASAIAYSTWLMWAGNHLATALYAAFNLGDVLLASCSALYALCCISVIVITARKRRAYQAKSVPRECASFTGIDATTQAPKSAGRVPIAAAWPSSKRHSEDAI